MKKFIYLLMVFFTISVASAQVDRTKTDTKSRSEKKTKSVTDTTANRTKPAQRPTTPSGTKRIDTTSTLLVDPNVPGNQTNPDGTPKTNPDVIDPNQRTQPGTPTPR